MGQGGPGIGSFSAGNVTCVLPHSDFPLEVFLTLATWGVGEGEGEREGERERQTDSETQKEIHTEIVPERQRDTQRDTERESAHSSLSLLALACRVG